MITIINKTKILKTYELDCAIAVKGGKKEKIKSFKDEKTKKNVKRGGMKIETDRVLTLVKGERRENLPDAVSQSKSIIAAKLRGEILVKVQKPAKKKVASKALNAKKQ
ncbi:MAG: hypothetical protein V3T43_02865 [Nitrosomonadaceae bacterium]